MLCPYRNTIIRMVNTAYQIRILMIAFGECLKNNSTSWIIEHSRKLFHLQDRQPLLQLFQSDYFLLDQRQRDNYYQNRQR